MINTIQYGKSVMSARSMCGDNRYLIGSYNPVLVRHLQYNGIDSTSAKLKFVKNITRVNPISHMLIANGVDLDKPCNLWTNAYLSIDRFVIDEDLGHIPEKEFLTYR